MYVMMEAVGFSEVWVQAYNNQTARHHAQQIHIDMSGKFWDTLQSQWGKSPVEIYQCEP
jgi:hypothetical protein